MVANPDKLGLYKRLKLEKVKKDLGEIQSAGKESILLIVKRLEKELIDQGYDLGIQIAIWHFKTGAFEIDTGHETIREEK